MIDKRMTDQDQETAVNGSSTHVARKIVKTPPGYFGNLSEQQQDALSAFEKEVAEQFGSVSPTSWYNEQTLLRFLRARRFNVQKAMQQFAGTDAWRKETNIDEKYAATTAEELRLSRRHYPRFLGRRDVYGRPIFVYRPASLDAERQKEIFSMDEEQRFLRVVLLTEMCVRFWLPMSSTVIAQNHETEEKAPVISEVMSIVDLDGASLGQLWKLRSHLGQASTLASAHYPETLGTTAIVNAPSFFSTIWGWIQKWFDEGTRNKMFIVTGAELQQGKLFEFVDKDDLPKVYGGTLDWHYEDEPSVEQAIKNVIGHPTVPDGPGDWNESDGSFILYDAEERSQFEKARSPSSS